MFSVLIFFLAALIGYLCGSIPFGYLYVLLVKGKDIRSVGSGRIGGTNSLRAAGLLVGVATSLSDVGKGALSVGLSRFLVGNQIRADLLPWVLTLAGVMSVVGHNWSVFMGWRGGAGTGPNVGWTAALWWPMLPIAAGLLFIILFGIGMASVASLAIGVLIPISFLILYVAKVSPFDASLAYMVGGIMSFTIVTWALRPNIKRLINGTERVVGRRNYFLKRNKET